MESTVGVGESVCVAVRVGVALEVGVGVLVGVDDGVKVGVIVGVVVAVGVQAAAIAVNDVEVIVACCSRLGPQAVRTRTIMKSIR